MCCRRRGKHSRRRRACRRPPRSAPSPGRRNGEDDMKRLLTRRLIVLAVVAAALAAGAFGAAKFWAAEAQLPAPGAAAPIPVVLPKLQSVTNYVEITGNAASVNDVKLLARVEGYLEKIHYEDGAFVKEGDLLFTIQQDQYKAQLQQVQAQVLTAQASLKYAKTEFA